MKFFIKPSKAFRFLSSRQLVAWSLLLVFFSTFLLFPSKPVSAQLVTSDITAAAQRIQIDVGNKFWNKVLTALSRAGSVSFQQLLKTSLNKIAYDTATYIGSGGKGQKPLFVTKDWGAYLLDIGNQSAGQFIENFVNTFGNTTVSYEAQEAYGNCASECSQENAASCDLSEIADSSIATEMAAQCEKNLIACVQGCREEINSDFYKGNNSTSTDYIGTSGSRGGIINVCQPSSIDARLKISLGLTEQNQPIMPNCSATELIQNWGDEVKRLTSFEDPDFLNKFKNVFNPVSNDLGIYMSLKTDLTKQVDAEIELNKTKLTSNKGWLDVRNIAGEMQGTPGSAESQKYIAESNYGQALLKTTGDIVVDAANIFLNQISLTAFNNLMSNLGKKASTGDNSVNFYSYSADPNISYGEVSVKETISKYIVPNFGTDANYNVLIGMSSCPNKDKPGPTECVIDNLFLQAVTEKKTVGEAVKSGYLNRNWRFSKDDVENAFTLRNISILRKYRILPLAWEQAIEEIYDSSKADRRRTNLMDLISCFEDGDEYNEFSRDFDKSDSGWCVGLIDPNWVLKAPLGYCAKEGIGAKKVFETDSPGSSQEGIVIPNIYSLTRAEEYCADEKTCIKEGDKGGCEVYGYCNEEKRTWNFNSESCEPIYNTCETFTNTSNRKQASYLQNTLDYGNCNADNVGCSQYALSGVFSTTTNTVAWNNSQGIYLTKADNCNRNAEGCTELIRLRSTGGENLIANADFAVNKIGDQVVNGEVLGSWPLAYSNNSLASTRLARIVEASEADYASSELTGASLRLSVSAVGNSSSPLFARLYSTPQTSLLPLNFEMIKGESYTFTADVYLSAGDRALVYLGDSGLSASAVTDYTEETGWKTLSVTRTASDAYDEPLFGVEVIINNPAASDKAEVYIKNLKFEVSNVSTPFSLYGAYKAYQKLIPPYLEDVCYVNNGQNYELKKDAPSICNNFTRRCNATEAGCELFSNKKKSLNIAAQITSSDYCREDCVGYDMYISSRNYFNSPQAENIIPEKLSSCSAAAVGCSEFTNLDKVSAGGESREYYSELKQCIKPSESLCGNFYSWEKTLNGPQLRLYSLKKDSDSSPETIAETAEICNADIYKKLPGEPLYNPDCKEFYNSAGGISYRLLSKTISCSDNCLSYRLNGNNFDYALSATECTSLGASANWDASVSACAVCLNGGVWDKTSRACIYQAIPGEGKTCSATEVGCREYNGADGSNLKALYSYGFESGLQGWYSNCDGGISLSEVSNNRNGKSVFYSGSVSAGCSAIGLPATQASASGRLINKVFASDNVAAQLKVGTSVSYGKSYNLRFIAKSDQGPVKIKAYLYNNEATNPQAAYFGGGEIAINGGGAWNTYQVNLSILDHEVGANEILIISADKDFYFDEVILTEISDKYYLIKGSAEVPDCSYDINRNYQGDKYNLGCSAYTDRAGNTHTLRKFSNLCSNSSVGCEQMIKTQNSASPSAGLWNDVNSNGACDKDELDCVKVAADETIFAIFNANLSCNQADKGCSLLGQSVNGAWSDVYKKNNPDNYSATICSQEEVGCSAWQTKNSGTSYFKDPGNAVCQYRNSSTATVSGKGWYLIPVNRCDSDNNGSIGAGETKTCSSSADCGGAACILDNNDYPCSASYFKTIGLGGFGNVIPVPDSQVGLCAAASAGCTEYIDPASKISPNLISNSEFKEVNDVIGFWTNGEQTVNIEPNKLYTISVRGGSSPTSLNFEKDVKELLVNNSFSDSKKVISIPAGSNKGISFLSVTNTKVRISGGEENKAISLREAIINYRIKGAVDKNSCSTVNVGDGCVLFNERTINGANGFSSLVGAWDAFTESANKPPVACSSTGENCNANTLIKVTPDRMCSKWLDCISYTIDEKTGQKTCYSLGQCNRLEGASCASFEEIDSSQVINFKNGTASNDYSGFFLLNRYHLAGMKEVGLNTDMHYDFEESIPVLSCVKTNGQECNFVNLAKSLLVREPVGSPVDYPANGKVYLVVPAGHVISPQAKDEYYRILPNKDYYINFLVNTQAGKEAKVKIITKNNSERFSKEINFSADDGWSREVIYFNSGKATELRIEFMTNSDSGQSYFDDINMEPVLQVGPNEFIAKECRLYPTTDSLTCVNKNEAVIKSGLEGYCLAHDSRNKDVCLMWYPVDKISSAKTTTNFEGYQGKYPLYYCTEVDGNFSLVKKLTAQPVITGQYGTAGTINTSNSLHWCYEPSGDDWKRFASTKNEDVAKYREKIFNEISSLAKKTCSENYFPLLAIGEYAEGSQKSYFKIMCIPRNDKINYLKSNVKTVSDMNACNGYKYNEGWTDYDKKLNVFEYQITPLGQDVCQEINAAGLVDPWCQSKYEGMNEGALSNPVRVYDYNAPPVDENGLMLVSGSDPDKVYRLTCNNFIQLVSSSGENKAWVDRVGDNSLFSTSTPDFFKDYNNNSSWYGSDPHKLIGYGRNREDVPFGAALLPDNFNLLDYQGTIKLRNQLSAKNKETVLAGRPYGCSNYKDGKSGCSNIGYCSLNPNVYCLTSFTETETINWKYECEGVLEEDILDPKTGEYKTKEEQGYCRMVIDSSTKNISPDPYVSQRTCSAGGFGTCVPLWNDYLGKKDAINEKDYQSILSQLFWKSYGSFAWSGEAYLSGNFGFNNLPSSATKPVISSVIFNGRNLGLGEKVSIPSKGLYKLEFTVSIDKNQQPLREIYIDWGDGSSQVFRGLDNKPDASSPHVFYHYYRSAVDVNIEIKALDNWDREGAWPSNS